MLRLIKKQSWLVFACAIHPVNRPNLAPFIETRYRAFQDTFDAKASA